MLQQNQLKFLINSRTHLNKTEHADRVAEAYFETEKTWFAALVQDINETTQEAEVAWIGYNIQETLQAEKITFLTSPDADSLFVGAVCNAVFPSDGMWYEATIEKVLTNEDAESFAAIDLWSIRRF